jgi:hypothetical protein
MANTHTTHIALTPEQGVVLRELLARADGLCSAVVSGQPGLMRLALDFAALVHTSKETLKHAGIMPAFNAYTPRSTGVK